MAAERFEAELTHDRARLAPLRHGVTAWLESGGIEREVRDAVVLSTHEAAANAMEHGAHGGAVTVRGEIGEESVIVSVTSAGGWKALAPSEYPGTGLVLIRALMSDVDIETDSYVSVVRMRLAL